MNGLPSPAKIVEILTRMIFMAHTSSMIIDSVVGDEGATLIAAPFAHRNRAIEKPPGGQIGERASIASRTRRPRAIARSRDF